MAVSSSTISEHSRYNNVIDKAKGWSNSLQQLADEAYGIAQYAESAIGPKRKLEKIAELALALRQEIDSAKLL